MAKYIPDSVFDAALEVIRGDSREMYVSSAGATTRAEAISSALASDTTSLNTAQFTIADGDAGDGNGRKLTVASVSEIDVSNTGTATHVHITDATNLLMSVECTSQALTSGNRVTVPSFKYQIADPT